MSFPFPLVPVDPEEVQRRQDAAEAEAHERTLRVKRFLDELSGPDLATFDEILVGMIRVEDPFPYINFLHGYTTSLLTTKHDLCICGVNHTHETLDAEKAKLDAERNEENDKPAMKEYGLERRGDGKLYCTGCGLEYQSLDDRMLRSPGPAGCGGCQQKAAWG